MDPVKKQQTGKTKNNWTIPILVIVFIMLGIVVYFWLSSGHRVDSRMSKKTGPADPKNWEKYENHEYNYSLKYPSGWQLEEKSADYIELRNPLK